MGQPEPSTSPVWQQPVLRSADLLALQSAILEAVVRGVPLPETLDLLCLRIEALAPATRCSVLLLEGQHLRHGAAPSLPKTYTEGVDGARIGPMAGSCGTAAFLGQTVEVTDIETDPRWESFRHLALPHGLRACWSTPIFGREHDVLGTFALYHGEARGPDALHRDAVQAATHLAAIAIERHRMDVAARERRAELERHVAERTQALDQRNLELQRTIDELHRTQSALIEARKLISLGRLVAGVAHELNTPIGNARLLATSLQEHCMELRATLATGGLRRKALDAFVQSLEDGSSLLSRALQAAAERINGFRALVVEHEDAQRTPFVLAELVRDTVLLLGPLARQAQCEVHCEVPATLTLDSYPAQLQQTLSNILTNAVQHGFADRKGGQVRVSAQALDQSRLEIRIADDGVGIAAADLERVFDPFFTTRMGQGYVGLGLHVAYTVVQGLLGGDIRIESRPGHGTTLILTLPFSAPQHSLRPRPKA